MATGRGKRGPRSRAAVQEEVVRGPGKVPIQLSVNGSVYSLDVEPRRTILEVLRTYIHLTGTKRVCNMGECGGCTVIMDGKAVYSCLILAIECEGRQILTIEGLSQNGRLDQVQEAFVKHDAYQCGFCTPGQVMSVRALLDHKAKPNQEEIRRAVSGNICRCGAYLRIFAAAEAAARAYEPQRSTRQAGR
jgi:xanthine dehydrogenase YagT iron-sulfur-binding subunit